MRVDYLVAEVKDHFLKYPDIKILLQSAESRWFRHLDFSNTLKKIILSDLPVGGTESYIFDNICFPDGKEVVSTSVTDFLYSYGVALIQTGVAYLKESDSSVLNLSRNRHKLLVEYTNIFSEEKMVEQYSKRVNTKIIYVIKIALDHLSFNALGALLHSLNNISPKGKENQLLCLLIELCIQQKSKFLETQNEPVLKKEFKLHHSIVQIIKTSLNRQQDENVEPFKSLKISIKALEEKSAALFYPFYQETINRLVNCSRSKYADLKYPSDSKNELKLQATAARIVKLSNLTGVEAKIASTAATLFCEWRPYFDIEKNDKYRLMSTLINLLYSFGTALINTGVAYQKNDATAEELQKNRDYLLHKYQKIPDTIDPLDREKHPDSQVIYIMRIAFDHIDHDDLYHIFFEKLINMEEIDPFFMSDWFKFSKKSMSATDTIVLSILYIITHPKRFNAEQAKELMKNLQFSDEHELNFILEGRSNVVPELSFRHLEILDRPPTVSDFKSDQRTLIIHKAPQVTFSWIKNNKIVGLTSNIKMSPEVENILDKGIYKSITEDRAIRQFLKEHNIRLSYFKFDTKNWRFNCDLSSINIMAQNNFFNPINEEKSLLSSALDSLKSLWKKQARRQDELLEQKVPKKLRLQDDLLEQKVPAILLSHKKYFESEGHFKLKLFDREKMIKYLEEEKALNYFEKNMDAFIFFQMICSYASEITILISFSQLFKIFKDLNNYYKEEDWPFILDMLKDSREAFLDKGDRTLLNKIINCVIIPGELTEEILEEIKQRKIRSASLNSKIEAAESSSFGLR